MDISQSRVISQRGFHFTGILEVVDCIDHTNSRTVFRKVGLRDTFLSIFPDNIFKEKGFRFFMDHTGRQVIMEVHDLTLLSDYLEAMSNMRLLGIHWDKIYDSIKERHFSN